MDRLLARGRLRRRARLQALPAHQALLHPSRFLYAVLLLLDLRHSTIEFQVQVGQDGLTYTPSDIQAPVGTLVTFVFSCVYQDPAMMFLV